MPLYDYRCEDCGHEFEEQRPVDRRDDTPCPKCRGRRVERPVRGVGLVGGSREGGAAACPPRRSGFG